MTTITEAEVEQLALGLAVRLGWAVAQRLESNPETPSAERDGYGQIVLECRPRGTLLPGLMPGQMGVGTG